jgi:hypothetical protein
MAKKVEDTIAAISGSPGDGRLGTPNQDAGETPEPEKPDTGDVEDSTVDFPLPEGFKPPAGIKNGEEFTALASLKMGEDGNLQLSKIDGIPVNGKAEDEDEDKEEEAGEQNPPGVTGAAGAIPSGGGSAVASARNVMGDMGMPA